MPLDLTGRIKDALARPGPVRTIGQPVYEVYWKGREAVVPSQRRERRADHAFDETYGTRTTGHINRRKLGIKSDNLQLAHAYAPIRPAEFAAVMDMVEVDFESSVFVDFGSGMGRALLLASDYPFRRIVGVEISPLLHEIALGNIEVYSSSSRISATPCPAATGRIASALPA